MRTTALSAGLLVSLFAAPESQAQILAKTLLFNTVQPCRVADTRVAAGGILIGGIPRTFDVVGATTNYSGQGGVSGGCGIPGFVGGLPQVQAVAVNIVAVSPTGEGFLTAWPTDQPFPSASTVNFQKLNPNLNIANGVIIPVRQNVPGGDMTIVAGVANTHVIVDITGYFSRAEPRQYYLTVATTFNGAQAPTACAAGYHMASLWEIFDTASLSYNTALGLPSGDGGTGQPATTSGWIRTGGGSFVAASPGLANCNGWTSTLIADHGTRVSVPSGWTGSPTLVSPWSATTGSCSAPFRVWCVED